MSARGGVDGPARLMSGTTWLLAARGADRAGWGRAMTGELAQLEHRGQRWRFALGCARATLVSGTGRGEPGRTFVLGALATAVGCVAVVAYGLTRFPSVVSGPGTWLALATFLVVLLGYLAVALVAAPTLSRTGAVGSRVAVVGGLVVAAGWLTVGLTPLVQTSLPAAFAGPAVALLLAVWVGVVPVARGRGRVAGIASVAGASVVAGLVVFLAWVSDTLATSGRPYDAGLVRDFRTSGARDLATYAVNDSLGSAMVLLVLVPLATVLVGAVGIVLWDPAAAVVLSRRGTR
jgi:hypothetical protein